MIDFYFQYRKNDKTQSRYDLIKYLNKDENYESLLMPANKKGDNYLYFGKCFCNINSDSKRKPNYCLKKNNKHFTGLYFIFEEKPNLCYGDVKNSLDLLIVQFNHDELEIFVFCNKEPFSNMITQQFYDEMISDEIELVREQAIRYNNLSVI